MMKDFVLFPLLVVLLTALAGCAQTAQGAAVPTVTPTDPYTIDITVDDFVDVVDNPWFPLIPGTQWVYEAELEDGEIERIELEILHETHEVNGVSATILHDSVFVDGELVEETFDWYAQDKDGNVWYLGEDVDNYEIGVPDKVTLVSIHLVYNGVR